MSYDQFNRLQNRKTAAGFQIAVNDITPNNSHSPGFNITGFKPAPYLPLLSRFDEEKYTYLVMSSGLPVALDSKGQLVPAGLRLDLANPVTAKVKYTQLDVTQGVLNAAGQPVTVGEAVVASFATAGITIKSHIGVLFQNTVRHAGGDNVDPAKLRNINLNPQPVVTVVRDAHMQYPVVADEAKAASTPMEGLAVAIAAIDGIQPGDFLTYDANSKFVVDTAPSLANTIAQVTAVRQFRDSTGKVVNSHNGLEHVIAPMFPNAATRSAMDQVASKETQGMGSYITYSDGWGVLEISLINR